MGQAGQVDIRHLTMSLDRGQLEQRTVRERDVRLPPLVGWIELEPAQSFEDGGDRDAADRGIVIGLKQGDPYGQVEKATFFMARRADPRRT